MALSVAIDCMGGDHGPSVTVPAALACLQAHPELSLILVGRTEPIEAALREAKVPAVLRSRLRVQLASEVVEMDEAPAQALRPKHRAAQHRPAKNAGSDQQRTYQGKGCDRPCRLKQ